MCFGSGGEFVVEGGQRAFELGGEPEIGGVVGGQLVLHGKGRNGRRIDGVQLNFHQRCLSQPFARMQLAAPQFFDSDIGNFSVQQVWRMQCAALKLLPGLLFPVLAKNKTGKAAAINDQRWPQKVLSGRFSDVQCWRWHAHRLSRSCRMMSMLDICLPTPSGNFAFRSAATCATVFQPTRTTGCAVLS